MKAGEDRKSGGDLQRKPRIMSSSSLLWDPSILLSQPINHPLSFDSQTVDGMGLRLIVMDGLGVYGDP
ncbi:hypothetical protein Tco_0875463 [Tanacetum coccineum]|uniref:Uncharacterized protein n=1 Tax=Tanacetum coccineum TaxID=301880 RepID=A0ABQ5BSE4_9ASTR